MPNFDNPWIHISPQDYEIHMSHPSVKQQKFLANCFRTSLTKHAPSDLLVIGCGTGNGFEFINPFETKRTTAIDVNVEFLQLLAQRHQNKVRGLEIVHADLHCCDIQPESYSLVYAGLVFEFLEPKIVIKKISKCLRREGKLEVVLQIPNSNLPVVSATNVASMKTLHSILNLVEPKYFETICNDVGLNLVESSIKTIDSGKSFFLGTFSK